MTHKKLTYTEGGMGSDNWQARVRFFRAICRNKSSSFLESLYNDVFLPNSDVYRDDFKAEVTVSSSPFTKTEKGLARKKQFEQLSELIERWVKEQELDFLGDWVARVAGSFFEDWFEDIQNDQTFDPPWTERAMNSREDSSYDALSVYHFEEYELVLTTWHGSPLLNQDVDLVWDPVNERDKQQAKKRIMQIIETRVDGWLDHVEAKYKDFVSVKTFHERTFSTNDYYDWLYFRIFGVPNTYSSIQDKMSEKGVFDVSGTAIRKKVVECAELVGVENLI